MALLVSDLRELIVGSYNAVMVFGNATVADGGGGIYYWDFSATNADDGAEWVKPSSIGAGSPGRWHRIEPYALPAHTHAGTYQAANTKLTALAATTSAADALPYFTGASSADTTTLSTFGRSLINATSAANARGVIAFTGENRTHQTELTGARSSSPADAGNYVAWENTGPKTYTVDASTLTIGDMLVGFNRAGTGTLTIAAAGGTGINGFPEFAPSKEYLIVVDTAATIDVIGGSGTPLYVAPPEPPPDGGDTGGTSGGTYDEEEPPVGARTVGTGKTYSTISAAVSASVTGDWILVDAGTYANDYPDINGKDLHIRGVGGYAELSSTGNIPNQVGILRQRGGATTVLENLKFVGAKVADENGAGIRYDDGNLTVRNCIFQTCENGILAAAAPAGTITLENSDFIDCGFGDGFTHGIYINGIAHIIADGCYFYANKIGHHLKSRAAQTTVKNCTFNNGTAETSRSIDLSNGGVALIENCLLQRPTGPYGNNDFIGYCPEGIVHATNSLLVKNCVFEDSAPGGFGVNNSYAVAITAQLQGNTFLGVATPVIGAHEYLTPDTGIVPLTLTDDI